MTSPFNDATRRALDDLHTAYPPDPNPDAPTPIPIRRLTGYVKIPNELLADYGLAPDGYAPPPTAKISRWRQLRWKLGDRWTNLRLRAGSWIAGINLNHEDW
ncbi:hypothetical protein [Herbidospora daliensis]|uniref:hypothetical protein n=1 Tax=Herbidospora daliensis TaxID=295585 RepID=UPI0007826E1D|nr:hypothetical protein [Herbidospora daliensis]